MTGLERIRFMTSHPKDLSDELIEVMSRFQEDLSVICICRCSPAAAEILKAMNRHYTKEQYLELAEKHPARQCRTFP